MPKRFPFLLAIPPLVFVGLAAMFYAGMQRGNPNELPSTLIGKLAPNVTQEGVGSFPTIEPSDLAFGEVTILNFWASWCPPCRAEHPTLLRLAGEGVHVLGVNFNDDENDANSYLANYQNPFAALAFDPKGRTAFDWGVAAPPETFILDADGTVLFRFIGPLVGSDYEQRFLPELERAIAGG